MRRAIAIRHVHFEDCGTLGEVLRERSIDLRYAEAGADSIREIDPHDADLLIGLGGPVSVYDAALYPWIADELSVYSRWLDAQKPLESHEPSHDRSKDHAEALR